MTYPAEQIEMGKRLVQARERKGMTRPAAVEALGVDYATYSGHENGSRGFKRSADRYARFYGVNLTWLVTGVGPMVGKAFEQRYLALPTEGREAVDRLMRSYENDRS